MYRERLVECADCGDRFKIIYDSKKQRQNDYSCGCGNFICTPDYFGSFSYSKGRYKEVPYEEQNRNLKYYEEDYIRLTNEEIDLLSEIDNISERLVYKEAYINNTDEDDLRLELGGCSKLNEGLTISVDIRLKSWGNEWKEYEVKEKHERIINALIRFKTVILRVVDKEIDLDKPREIWNDESLDWYDGTRTQQKIYDYELVC